MSEASEGVVRNGEATYRRRYVRVAVSFEASYVVDGTDQAKAGETTDLGGGGIRLATHDDLPLGAVLMVSFKLPGTEREVVARGRIVLSFYDAEAKRFFHGIAFTQISPQDQEEIISWVGDRVHRLALENEAAD